MKQIVVTIGSVGIGFEDTQLMSLGLGSCVGIVMYEPGIKIAAMGHAMLPDSSQNLLSLDAKKDSIFLAVPDKSYSDILTNVLQKQNYNLLANETNKENIFIRYPQLKPSLVILDREMQPSGIDILGELIAKDNSANVLMLCRNFSRESFETIISTGAKDILYTPLSEDRITVVTKCVLHNHLLKFVDVMVPYMLEKLVMLGLNRSRLVAKLAGGAQLFADKGLDDLKIGERNLVKTKQLLYQNNIRVLGEDTRGNFGRTMVFDMAGETCNVKTKDGIKGI